MRAILFIFVSFICLAHSAAESLDSKSSSAKVEWAKSLDLAGVPNLHKISDSLYRSAQPSAEGMKNLKSLGIKTVINLRSFHSDRATTGAAGLGYEHIFVKTWHPENEDVVKFLKIVTDPSKVPVLVHCQYGADRTGAMSAIYRVVVQGWSKEDALKEMNDGGFGFHEVWANLISWIEKLDIEKLRSLVGNAS